MHRPTAPETKLRPLVHFHLFAETKNNPFYNRFSYTKFLVSSINTDRDSENIIRNASLFVSDLNELSENQFHLSVDLAKKIGVTAIIQPGGSIKDKSIIEIANKHNISMAMSGIRVFKH